MARVDKAVATAREVIDGLICDCGHTKDEHLMFDESSKCGEKPCRCREFRPVTFTVERA
jgi:hypothetical protein